MDNSSQTQSKPVYATDSSFQTEVIEASQSLPVIVDMYAEWCPPCKMIAPIIDKLATEYAGKVKFVKVDTDKNQALSMQYNIRSIPTLMIFFKGEIIFNQAGALPEHSFKELINQVLSAIAQA